MNIAELFDRPDQFLLAFESGNAVFAEMDRNAYHCSIFCDGRITPASKQMTRTAVAPLCDYRDREVRAAPAISYIFHVAHCGSTLLARALDIKDENIVYREPLALRQLAVEAASAGFAGAAIEDWRRRLRLTTSLLARRYNKRGPAVVKANVPVNFIIPDLLELDSGAPSIILYFPLEHYLMAILRSPGHQKWVASIFGEMQRAIGRYAPIEQTSSVAQAAAALWFAQISVYHEALTKYANVASLNAEDLFERPASALRRAFEHIGIPRADAEIESIARGELFFRYSKNPQIAFDNASRLKRREALRQSLGPEIEEARTWVEKARSTRPFPASLAKPLVGEAPKLLMRV